MESEVYRSSVYNRTMRWIAFSLALVAVVAVAQREEIRVPAAKIKPMPSVGQPGQGPERLAGTTPADWKMTTIDGKSLTGKGLRGKVVLVDFWATWCGPCKKASPIMESLHKKYGKQGLVVIGANTSERDSDGRPVKWANAAKEYKKEHGYTYTFTWGNDDLKKKWGVQGIPTMFVIDKKGVVKKVLVGFDDKLEANLEAVIKPLL